MKFENINKRMDKNRVLIAPLDWGLGHATRCIPIIYELLALNVEVIIAASGKTKILLQKEFPGLVFIQLKGYNIIYSRAIFWFPLKIFVQFPKIIWRIYSEHLWLKKIINKYHIDAVISDNRLGLYHSGISCVYITHQLKIKTGNRFTEWLAQKIHYFFINKYTVCWVPDYASENNLAGELSHPKQLPKTPVKYLGALSRFEKITVDKKYDLLVLLSGPEPQRTIFEALITKELNSFSGTFAMIKGLPEILVNEELILNKENNMAAANHLSAAMLNKAIQQSEVVIARSGYTTIMDLVKLQHKAILIPTPGQTEQEYLADYLMKKKIVFSVEENSFSLKEAISNTGSFLFANTLIMGDEYKEVIKQFVKQFKK